MCYQIINLTCLQEVPAHNRYNISVSFYLLISQQCKLTKLCSYLLKMLVISSSIPFYADHVYLPHKGDPTPSKIYENSKFYPFFKDALGAIDGMHINCCPPAADHEALHDYKGHITQNCLAICNFNMTFCYVCSRWGGSAPDSTMFYDIRVTDLPFPRGKYYLANAGFPTCDTLLIPYQGV